MYGVIFSPGFMASVCMLWQNWGRVRACTSDKWLALYFPQKERNHNSTSLSKACAAASMMGGAIGPNIYVCLLLGDVIIQPLCVQNIWYLITWCTYYWTPFDSLLQKYKQGSTSSSKYCFSGNLKMVVVPGQAPERAPCPSWPSSSLGLKHTFPLKVTEVEHLHVKCEPFNIPRLVWTHSSPFC